MYSPHRDLLVVFPEIFKAVAESLEREIADGVLAEIEPDPAAWVQLVDALFQAIDTALRAPVAVSLYATAAAAGVLDAPPAMRNHLIGRFGEMCLATFVSMSQESTLASEAGSRADVLAQARRDAAAAAERTHTVVAHAVHAIGIMTDPTLPARLKQHPSVQKRWQTAPQALRPDPPDVPDVPPAAAAAPEPDAE